VSHVACIWLSKVYFQCESAHFQKKFTKFYFQKKLCEINFKCEIGRMLTCSYSGRLDSLLAVCLASILTVIFGLNFVFQQEAFEKCFGPIHHCEPPHAALPFTRCRYCRTPPLSHATCTSMSTTTTTTTTTTTRNRGDRYGPIEWAQS